jgi:hypothetical protein
MKAPKGLAAVAMLVLAVTPAFAHRLDEYLQSALISIEKTRVQVQATLTPGTAVFPAVFAAIDVNADGIISEIEQRAYAARVLNDLSLTIDGQALTPRLISIQFPAVEDMRDGRGDIQMEYDADLPAGGPNRSLVLKNHHQSRIAAYQVNCLVPSDPGVRIVAQRRNYSQSFYQLDYVQAGASSGSLSSAPWSGAGWLGAFALLLFARFALRRKERAA